MTEPSHSWEGFSVSLWRVARCNGRISGGVAGGRRAHGSQDSRSAVQSRSDCQIRCKGVFGNFPTPLMSAQKVTRGCCCMQHQFVQNEPLAIFFELVGDLSFLSCQMPGTFSANMYQCPLDSQRKLNAVSQSFPNLRTVPIQHSCDNNFQLFHLMAIFPISYTD